MIYSGVIAVAVAYLFYNSWIGIIPGVVVGFISFKTEKEKIRKNKKRRLLKGFQDLMTSVDAALEAGFSLENAILAAYGDLSVRYSKKDRIMQYLAVINRRVSMNEPIDTVLMDIALKTELKEMIDFADVIRVVKQSGGNTINIIRETVENISERIAVEKEIEVIIAGKQLEQRIMMIMPFVVILYMRLSMSNFMKGIYGNIPGMIFMTFMLCLVVIADKLGRNITSIEV